MVPARSWGFSPLCLWVERKLGDERQRAMAKRLLFTLLVTSGFVLAYSSVTLPLRIETVWSRNLSGEITHASTFLDRDHGEVIAVALARNHNGSWTYNILLLDGNGGEIGDFCNAVPMAVREMLYLPTQENPTMIIGLHQRYVSGPSYILRPNITRLEVKTEPGEPEEFFSPGRVDAWTLRDGRILLVGFSPLGRSYLVAQIYSGQTGELRTVWIKELHSSEVCAKIMDASNGEPVILAAETPDALVVYDMNGSKLREVNLTEILLSRKIFQGNARVVSSIRGDDSVFGREKAGIYFRAFQRDDDGSGPSRYFFVYLDSQLQVLNFWEDAPFLNDPRFISLESKIITGDICLGIDGEVAWIRRGSWNMIVEDLDGDGFEEVISKKPALFGKSANIQIFDACGGFVARGAFPGQWGDLAAADLDSDGRKEILYYVDTQLHLLRIGDAPYLPRLVAQVGLLLLILAFLLLVVRSSWPPHPLRKLFEILTLRFRERPSPLVRDRLAHSGKVVKHEEYRVCECGARNPISARVCSECGKEFRRRRTYSADLSARGGLSRMGVAIGVFGLLIYSVTPIVWSVEPSDHIHKVIRAFFAVVSPTVLYMTWISVATFLLAFGGVCLIYLERSALTGAMACLLALGVSMYLASSGGRFPLFPFILVGVCGLLQFAQKIVMERRSVV